MKINLKNISLFILAFLVAIPLMGQEKLSRKERKQQHSEAVASRLFIDGQRFLILEDFERAYFYFQKAREIKPDDAAINFKIAEILLRANRVDEAMEYGMKAVAGDPDNKYYNLVMAEAFTKQGELEKAAGILESLMANSEENQNYILDLASLYLSIGDADKALEALNRAEDFYGMAEQLTVQKQRIYLRKNNLNAAIKEGEKLIEAHPGNSQYVLNLVEILFNNGRTNQALNLVNSSLEAYPNQGDLQLAAYALYKDLGEVDRAESLILQAFANPDLEGKVKSEAFGDILREPKTVRRDSLLDKLSASMESLHPYDPDVLTVLGDRMMFENKKEEALRLYMEAINRSPSNAQVLQAVITTKFELQKEYSDIETYTIIAVDEHPERAEFWFFDGTAKLAQKKAEEAEDSFLKSIEVNRARNKQLDLLVQASLGDTYHQLGEKEKAFEAYEEVLKSKPDDEHVLNNYAYFLSLAKQDLEKAKSMSERLVKRFPENSTYLDTHAWVLFQMKDYENAKIYMEKALENEDKPSGVMLEHYGDILYHLGNRNEAISFWKQAEGGEETSEFLLKKIKDQKYYD
ncbi:tetratricopeptide repeat protein [Cecembia lonarensis]|uniref:Tetratricopeptide repeat protein n=1 Tax=Cecembia lonarensis (strain CCUG 58316 / KCTC 22772 / LW9) TaxID=1225176 RepID=K1L227_CECL9|nr:tetratricopeptide repeat protein [Cecembia lonarensis]EKB48791.1 tetratricopeptide repeat protein [Cecembia lonarensis LW9]